MQVKSIECQNFNGVYAYSKSIFAKICADVMGENPSFRKFNKFMDEIDSVSLSKSTDVKIDENEAVHLISESGDQIIQGANLTESFLSAIEKAKNIILSSPKNF